MSEKTIGQVLSRIQKEIKAPKENKNTFGNYSYRSAEDILEAVKKCLQDGEFVTCSDTVELIGDRYYVKAEAKLTYGNGELLSLAYAREEETKKGMDAAQITGSASSYARKYALNGLFAIDDTKDADSMDNSKPEVKQDKFSPENKSIQAMLITKITMCNSPEEIDSLMDEHKDDFETLPEEMTGLVNEQINNRKEQIKKDIHPVVKSHKFVSTKDAIDWMNKMAPVVKGFKSIKLLNDWENYNRPWINGLDCLKAETYKKDGKSPKERMLDALMAKRNELENINTAQQPIG